MVSKLNFPDRSHDSYQIIFLIWKKVYFPYVLSQTLANLDVADKEVDQIAHMLSLDYMYLCCLGVVSIFYQTKLTENLNCLQL